MLQKPLPNINLSTFVLQAEEKTIEDYDGWCSSVCDTVLKNFGGSTVFVDGNALLQYGWCYHKVPMVNGLIHDAWFAAWHLVPEPKPLHEWLIDMFGTEDEIEVMVDGENIYSGLPQNFKPCSTGSARNGILKCAPRRGTILACPTYFQSAKL